MVEAKGVWNSALIILDRVTGPNLVGMDFYLASWALSVQNKKTSRLLSASNAPMKIKGMLSLKAQMGQLQNEIGVLVAPNLAKNIIFSTAFIRKIVEMITARRILSCKPNRASSPKWKRQDKIMSWHSKTRYWKGSMKGWRRNLSVSQLEHQHLHRCARHILRLRDLPIVPKLCVFTSISSKNDKCWLSKV